MSTSYEAFFPEVLPYVHDCAEFVAINAIRNACIEFCDRSHYILYETSDIDAVTGVASYDLTLPDGMMIARIMDGWFTGLQLKPKSEDELRAMFPLDWRTMMGRPQYVSHMTPATVVLTPRPTADATGAINFIVALRPRRDSTVVDDVVYDRFAEQIGWGARARLYETPNQPYSDPAQGLYYRARFRTAIAEATIERNRGLTRSAQFVRPPRLI